MHIANVEPPTLFLRNIGFTWMAGDLGFSCAVIGQPGSIELILMSSAYSLDWGNTSFHVWRRLNIFSRTRSFTCGGQIKQKASLVCYAQIQQDVEYEDLPFQTPRRRCLRWPDWTATGTACRRSWRSNRWGTGSVAWPPAEPRFDGAKAKNGGIKIEAISTTLPCHPWCCAEHTGEE